MPPTRGKSGGVHAEAALVAASAATAAVTNVPFLIESKRIFPPDGNKATSKSGFEPLQPGRQMAMGSMCHYKSSRGGARGASRIPQRFDDRMHVCNVGPSDRLAGYSCHPPRNVNRCAS